MLESLGLTPNSAQQPKTFEPLIAKHDRNMAQPGLEPNGKTVLEVVEDEQTRPPMRPRSLRLVEVVVIVAVTMLALGIAIWGIGDSDEIIIGTAETVILTPTQAETGWTMDTSEHPSWNQTLQPRLLAITLPTRGIQDTNGGSYIVGQIEGGSNPSTGWWIKAASTDQLTLHMRVYDNINGLIAYQSYAILHPERQALIAQQPMKLMLEIHATAQIPRAWMVDNGNDVFDLLVRPEHGTQWGPDAWSQSANGSDTVPLMANMAITNNEPLTIGHNAGWGDRLPKSEWSNGVGEIVLVVGELSASDRELVASLPGRK